MSSPLKSGRRRALSVALPFLLGGFGVRLAVAPLGDAIAGELGSLAFPRAARVAVIEGAGFDDEPRARGITSSAFEDIFASGTRVEGAPVASPADAPKGTLVVPASAVTRALARRDVGATNALAPDGSPLGARLVGVSRYRTGLRDGDVVISVGGTRTPNVAAMVAAGMGAASGNAPRITGRIVRPEGTYAVVIELPAAPAPAPAPPPPAPPAPAPPPPTPPR